MFHQRRTRFLFRAEARVFQIVGASNVHRVKGAREAPLLLRGTTNHFRASIASGNEDVRSHRKFRFLMGNKLTNTRLLRGLKLIRV